MISMYIVCLCAMIFEVVWYPSPLSSYCMISMYVCVYNTGISYDIPGLVWYPKLYDIPLSSYCMISMYIVCLCAMIFEVVWYPSPLSSYCMISMYVCVYYISGCMISLYFCVYNTGILYDIPGYPRSCMISQVVWYPTQLLLYDIYVCVCVLYLRVYDIFVFLCV